MNNGWHLVSQTAVPEYDIQHAQSGEVNDRSMPGLSKLSARPVKTLCSVGIIGAASGTIEGPARLLYPAKLRPKIQVQRFGNKNRSSTTSNNSNKTQYCSWFQCRRVQYPFQHGTSKGMDLLSLHACKNHVLSKQLQENRQEPQC